MTWENVEDLLMKEMQDFTFKIQALAPYKSSYMSDLRGELVPFIHVDGKRVRTNSNRLHDSITFKYVHTNGLDIVAQTVVSGSIPYYDDAVLKPTREVARHYGRTEYGSIRYADSKIKIKENKNFMYYMKGEHHMQDLISKWNNVTIEVTDDMGDFL